MLAVAVLSRRRKKKNLKKEGFCPRFRGDPAQLVGIPVVSNRGYDRKHTDISFQCIGKLSIKKGNTRTFSNIAKLGNESVTNGKGNIPKFNNDVIAIMNDVRRP